MNKATLAAFFTATLLITACQNGSQSPKESPWKDKHITSAMLNLTSSSASSGTHTSYSLGYEPKANQVTLTFSNPSTVPIKLQLLTFHHGNNNQCVVQAAGTYQIPASTTTTFNVIDFKTFENCVLGYNDAETGRYQISIDNNATFVGVNTTGGMTDTSTEPFILTIEFKHGNVLSTDNLAGFAHYTRSNQF